MIHDKAEKEAALKEKLDKAAIYMKNVRGNKGMEWDGKRLDTEGLSVHALEQKVGFCCWWWRYRRRWFRGCC